MDQQSDPYNASIKLQRRPNHIGCLGKLRLLVDNQEIGSIGNGKEELFKIPSGSHTISIASSSPRSWPRTQTIELNLSPGDVRTFECGVSTQRIMQSMIITLPAFTLLAVDMVIKAASRTMHVRKSLIQIAEFTLPIVIGILVVTMIVYLIVYFIQISKPGAFYYLKEMHTASCDNTVKQ